MQFEPATFPPNAVVAPGEQIPHRLTMQRMPSTRLLDCSVLMAVERRDS